MTHLTCSFCWSSFWGVSISVLGTLGTAVTSGALLTTLSSEAVWCVWSEVARTSGAVDVPSSSGVSGAVGSGTCSGLSFATTSGGGDCLVGVGVGRSFSLFFSSVRRKAFNVIRSALLGLQRLASSGLCAQTGQLDGRDVWPVITVSYIRRKGFLAELDISLQFSHMAWSQQGSRNAFQASLLQIAHLSLNGISSWVSELAEC